MNGPTPVHHKASIWTLIFLSGECDPPQEETLRAVQRLSSSNMFNCRFVTFPKTHFDNIEMTGLRAGLFALSVMAKHMGKH